MLFEEFREGTGCKDNRHNREIYRKVESLYYTAETMTKAEAYEIARPYLNNEPSEEEKTVWQKVRAEVDGLEWDAMRYDMEAAQNTEWSKDTESAILCPRYYRDEAKRYGRMAREARAKARAMRNFFPEAFKA